MSTKQKVQELVSLVEQGRMTEALERHYADDVVMQENLNPPTVGLAANLARERAFFGSLRSVQFRARSVVTDGDLATINWVFETESPDGTRRTVDELAYQTWRDGKVVRERFYYDPGARAA
jgi:ketosteroid isomerase-like protein